MPKQGGPELSGLSDLSIKGGLYEKCKSPDLFLSL